MNCSSSQHRPPCPATEHLVRAVRTYSAPSPRAEKQEELQPAQRCFISTPPFIGASSTGRCNTFQCIDSTMLPQENHPFGRAPSKTSQGSVPAGLTLTSDFSFCLQCKAAPSLALRRPIETTGPIRT